MKEQHVEKVVVLLLLVAISATFVAMLRPFLMTLLMAAIMSGLMQPLQRRLVRWTRGRRTLAAVMTLALFLAVIVVPLLSVLGIVANEAYNVSQRVAPWVQRLREGSLDLGALKQLPFADRILPHGNEILAKASQLVAAGGGYLVDAISAITRGTAQVAFQFVVLLYSMFFFLKDGPAILGRILYLVPLSDADERRMVEKFVLVTRAMLKGTLVIASLQGVLTGGAIAVCGIDGALFWGTLAVVLATIPGVGTAFVWVPCVIYLFATRQNGAAIFLLIFCAGIVGTLDNFLRPRLVGKATQMHDLLVFLGILGGIALFGLPGFIVGPILTALFIVIWDIYGMVFKDSLPRVVSFGGAGGGVPRASTAPEQEPKP